MDRGYFPGGQARRALVRGLPQSFSECLKLHAPETPIDVARANEQHDRYVEALKKVVETVVDLSADERHPDCCFIEDAAIIIGDRAAITRPGAPERRGEVAVVRQELARQGVKLEEIEAPATVDGGDVLYTGRHLMVGLSKRTNDTGAARLAEIFGQEVPVITAPVDGTLHFKSLMSALDPETLIFGDTEAGRALHRALDSRHDLSHLYRTIWVPDAIAANVLSFSDTLFIQDGFPKSAAILEAIAREKGLNLVRLNMSELIKADSALTCCSLLY
jgi:dimethylargininase